MRPKAPGATRESVGVTALTAAAACIAFVVVAHTAAIERSAQRDADITRARIAAANDALGHAARVGSASAGAITGQAAAAVTQSFADLQTADAVPTIAFAVDSSDATRLDGLRQQTRGAAQDMFAAAGDLLTAVSSSRTDGLAPLIGSFASREGAYTDALAAEASFYDDADARATVDVRAQGAASCAIVLLVLGIGIGVVIIPAQRRAARTAESAIRSEEQEARIGSEVARHVAERDRREAEAQFQALFRRSVVGVALTDARGWILESNEALQRMLGFSDRELHGSLYGEWAIDGDTGAAAGAVGERRERLFRRKNGSTLWVEQTSTIAPSNADGAPPGTIWMVQDIEKRKNAERRLQHDATHDRLTGLRNRGYFDEIVDGAVHACSAGTGAGFAVFMVDLDSFKYVNDTHGHAAGDALLAHVGERLRTWASSDQIVARYGGDEFAVFLPDVGAAEPALEQAARLERALDEPAMVGGAEMRATASIGICLWSDHFADGDALMRAADAATYRAKATGRARAVLYDSAMAQHDDLRRRIGIELHTAIERDELHLEFQPIVSLPRRACVGFEALARWVHPTLGRVAPSIFIPVAEEVGLMRPIGSWVVRSACAQLARWQRDARLPDVKLNVNVSTHQMADPSFVDFIHACVAETGVDARRLGLELTETAMLDRNGVANEALAKIRAMGIPVVLDDFGTGYSSLSYLQLLPMDALKIDQSFVRSPHDGLASPAIVHALISLSKSLGISVVAEGVETEQQAAHLERIGCPAAQGYLFSKSVSADAALEFLLSSGRAANAV